MRLFFNQLATISTRFSLWLLTGGLFFVSNGTWNVTNAETAVTNPTSQGTSPPPEKSIAWELSPYRVAWEFRDESGDRETSLQQTHRTEFEQLVLNICTRSSSGLWQSSVRHKSGNAPITPADVEIFVTWKVDGGGYSAFVTLAQPAYNRHERISIARQPDLDALAKAILRSCLEHFAPDLRLTTGASGQLIATHRGELLFRETRTLWSPRNLSLAIPWIFYLNEQGAIVRQEPVEWTVLELPAVGAPVLHSGSRTNLAGRGRSQIELRGLLIPPNDQPTQLAVLTLGSRQPQPGLDVFVSEEPLVAATRVQLMQLLQPSPKQEPPASAENNTGSADSAKTVSAQPPQLLLVTTNLRGEVLICPEKGQLKSRLLWLNVFGGDQLLARVPIIAGAVKQARLFLPDDGPRREAEAQLQSLSDEITLIVARRTSLLARLRNASRQRNWQLVNDLRKQIGQLPTDQNVEAIISAIQSTSLEAAEKVPSRSAAERIRRQCAALVRLAQQHLGTEALKVLDEEIAQLRTLDDTAPPITPRDASP